MNSTEITNGSEKTNKQKPSHTHTHTHTYQNELILAHTDSHTETYIHTHAYTQQGERERYSVVGMLYVFFNARAKCLR